VVVDADPTPIRNLGIIKPDYFAKGYEYTAGAVHPKTQEEIDILDSYGGEMIFTPGDIVYSSSALIELAPPSIAVEKLMTLMEAEGVTFDDLRKAITAMKGVKVHVVGDTIVDSYTYCGMIGGMTKTPTMSVRFEKKVDYVGGAGIVAKHLRAAGAEVTGVLPKALMRKEIAHEGLTRLEVVTSMHERKQLMYDQSDAFVVAPGGVGTLE
jgi:bifunctional ADP-heptose synthase (sugar kinase/adenylyltransferase)